MNDERDLLWNKKEFDITDSGGEENLMHSAHMFLILGMRDVFLVGLNIGNILENEQIKFIIKENCENMKNKHQ